MAETIACPGCQASLRFRPHYRGHTVACKHCDQAFYIPKHDLISCPQCQKELRVPFEFLGKAVVCNQCLETFDAPASGTFSGVIPVVGGSTSPPRTPDDDRGETLEAPTPGDPSGLVTAYSNTLAQLRESRERCDALQHQEQTLRAELAHTQAERDRLGVELQQLRVQIADLERQRTEHHDHLAEARSALEQVHNELDNARQHLDTFNARANEANEQLQALQVEWTQERQTLLAERAELQARLASIERTSSENLARLTTDRDALSRTLRDVNARWGAERRQSRARVEEALQCFNHDRREFRLQLQVLGEQAQALLLERAELDHRLEAEAAERLQAERNHQAERDRLQTDLSAAQEQAAELARLEHERNQLVERLNAGNRECRALQEQLAAAKRWRQDIEARLAAPPATEAELTRLRAELAQAHQRASAAATENEELGDRLCSLEAELEHQRRSQGVETESLQQRIAQLEADLANARRPSPGSPLPKVAALFGRPAPRPESSAAPLSASWIDHALDSWNVEPSQASPPPPAASSGDALTSAERRIAELTEQLRYEQTSKQRYRTLLDDLGITVDNDW